MQGRWSHTKWDPRCSDTCKRPNISTTSGTDLGQEPGLNWADNADIEGRAAAYRRARTGNSKKLSCAQYKGVNGWQPTFDVVHMRNHRYDPMAFASEQACTCEIIDTWLVSCEDEVATAVAAALSDTGVSCVSEDMQGSRPFGAETIRAKTPARSQADVPRKDIVAPNRKWRGATDLALRLNYPYCKEKDTNAHYLHLCGEPTVVAARRKHLSLLAAAIHTYKLKKSTANALAAMCDLDDLGRHIDPGAHENGICEGLIEHLIGTNLRIEPVREPCSPSCRWDRPNGTMDGPRCSSSTGCSSWGSR